ncbi:hypothetical protein D3C76_1447430 [compost metagenome]
MGVVRRGGSGFGNLRHRLHRIGRLLSDHTYRLIHGSGLLRHLTQHTPDGFEQLAGMADGFGAPSDPFHYHSGSLHRGIRILADGADLLGNFLRGFAGLVRQLLHFLRHHSEAPAMLACAGRLYGSIDG